MRVLLATDVFPPRCGGSGWSTYHLARTLRQRGHSVAIVRPSPRVGAGPYEFDGFTVEQVAWPVPPVPVVRNVVKNELFWSAGARRLAAFARAHDAQVIHGQHVMTIPAAVVAGRALGVPVIGTVRDYWPTCPVSTRLRPDGLCTACSPSRLTECLAGHRPAGLPVARLLQGYIEANRRRRQAALRALDALVAVSRYVGDDLLRNAGLSARVVPNLVEIPAELPPAPGGWPPDEPYIVFVGKLDAHKGADRVPGIIAHLEPAVGLVALGDGPLAPMLRTACTQQGRRCQVGPVGNADVLRFLAHARALVFPARWPEPLSRVLLEAASVGCPAVATPTGGTPDIVVDGETGFLVPEIDAFGPPLQRLIHEPGLRASQREAARVLARQRFAPAVVASMVEEIYTAALERRP